MYITKFWCGVAATLIVEFIFVTVGSFLYGIKNGAEDETTEETD